MEAPQPMRHVYMPLMPIVETEPTNCSVIRTAGRCKAALMELSEAVSTKQPYAEENMQIGLFKWVRVETEAEA
eukprot:scaffold265400_cov36-Prasinocladus_malaysianus.AAC.1